MLVVVQFLSTAGFSLIFPFLPVLAASLAALVSYRGVILGASLIYLVVALVVISVARLARRRVKGASTLWSS